MNDERKPTAAGTGLADLAQVKLSPDREHVLLAALHSSGGSPAWRARKAAEARELLALAELAPRMEIWELDLGADLRAVIHLEGPVACLPGGQGALVIERHALLGLTYRQEALSRPLSGYAFVQILAPHGVWLPNVSADAAQAICLGTSLPAGVRVRDLVLMSFDALTMRSVQMDELDPAGVLNGAAARFWQSPLNATRIPLGTSPFLGPVHESTKDAT